MTIVPILNGIQSYPWSRRHRGKAEFLSDTVIRMLESHYQSPSRGYLWAYGKGGPEPWNTDRLLNWVRSQAYPVNDLVACGYSYGGHDLVRELLVPLARDGSLDRYRSVRVLIVDADWITLLGGDKVLGVPRGARHVINLYQRAQPRPQGALVTAEDCPHVENREVHGVTHESIDNCPAVATALLQLLIEIEAQP